MKTVENILSSSKQYCLKHNVFEAEIACEYLMSCLLKCKRLDLQLKHDQVLNEKFLEAMRRGIKRLADGEPVQYIVGHWDFYGRKFKTDKRALIPRPETELLVETILKEEILKSEELPAVVDIGTGSGCIIITLVLELNKKGRFLGVDISDDALSLAKENVALHELENIVLLTNAELSDVIEPMSLDLVVANLPYVTTDEYENLPAHVKNFEPKTALEAGSDGMDTIEIIVEEAFAALKPQGVLFLEIGIAQGQRVIELLNGFGYCNVEVIKDLTGRDRIVRAQVGDI
ncbi:MAG: peptide chain release factor N(5)-glutamine methyltransferase [Kiritimatiellae bacterium]|nr:peptide chain release factor N(5)-glutamine methyltransferase [Kiritimatiellia bacterium]